MSQTHTDIDNIEKTYKNQNMSHTPLIYENTLIENDEINKRIQAIIQTKNAACVATSVVTCEVANVNTRDSSISSSIAGFGVDNISIINKTPQNFKPYEYEEEEIFNENNVEICEVLSKMFPDINLVLTDKKTIESISIANLQIYTKIGYTIKSVKKITNKSLDFMFEARQKASNNFKINTTYHGTTENNAISICKRGYVIQHSRRAKFGKGIYTSPLVWMALLYAKLQENKDNEESILQVLLVNNSIDGSKSVGYEGQEDFGDYDILTDKKEEIYCARTPDMLQVKYVIIFERNINNRLTEMQKNYMKFFEAVIWSLNKRIENANRANIKLNNITWNNMIRELHVAGFTDVLVSSVVGPILGPIPGPIPGLISGAGTNTGANTSAGTNTGPGTSASSGAVINSGAGASTNTGANTGVLGVSGNSFWNNYTPPPPKLTEKKHYLFNDKYIKIGSKIKILNAFNTFKLCIGRTAKIMNIVKTHRLYLYVEIENKEINDNIIKINNNLKKKDNFPHFKHVSQEISWIVIPIQTGYFELIEDASTSAASTSAASTSGASTSGSSTSAASTSGASTSAASTSGSDSGSVSEPASKKQKI